MHKLLSTGLSLASDSGDVLCLSLDLCRGASRHAARGTGSCCGVGALVQGYPHPLTLRYSCAAQGVNWDMGQGLYGWRSVPRAWLGLWWLSWGCAQLLHLQLLHLQRGFSTCCPRFHCSRALAQALYRVLSGEKGAVRKAVVAQMIGMIFKPGKKIW